jgi:hypothetical protein
MRAIGATGRNDRRVIPVRQARRKPRPVRISRVRLSHLCSSIPTGAAFAWDGGITLPPSAAAPADNIFRLVNLISESSSVGV